MTLSKEKGKTVRTTRKEERTDRRNAEKGSLSHWKEWKKDEEETGTDGKKIEWKEMQ